MLSVVHISLLWFSLTAPSHQRLGSKTLCTKHQVKYTHTHTHTHTHTQTCRCTLTHTFYPDISALYLVHVTKEGTHELGHHGCGVRIGQRSSWIITWPIRF